VEEVLVINKIPLKLVVPVVEVAVHQLQQHQGHQVKVMLVVVELIILGRVAAVVAQVLLVHPEVQIKVVLVEQVYQLY
jgi:hypothetical protein